MWFLFILSSYFKINKNLPIWIMLRTLRRQGAKVLPSNSRVRRRRTSSPPLKDLRPPGPSGGAASTIGLP